MPRCLKLVIIFFLINKAKGVASTRVLNLSLLFLHKTLKRTFFLVVDGNWGEWGKWNTCSKTCKQGKQSRKRDCNSPAPQYGGKKCEGDSSQDQVCNEDVPCPGV